MVVSFSVDHTKLSPGLYVRDKISLGENIITVYDLRFKTPNAGDYLTPTQAHTIEHVLAVAIDMLFGSEKIYVGPMGCLTGFYVILGGDHDEDYILDKINEITSVFDYYSSIQRVPADNKESCGNYRMLDINEGYREWEGFVDILEEYR